MPPAAHFRTLNTAESQSMLSAPKPLQDLAVALTRSCVKEGCVNSEAWATRTRDLDAGSSRLNRTNAGIPPLCGTRPCLQSVGGGRRRSAMQ
jgi:hypothetical protein